MLTMNEKDKNENAGSHFEQKRSLSVQVMGGHHGWGRLVLCQEKVQIKYNQFSLFM